MDLKTPLSEVVFCCLDFETTGFDACGSDRVVEVSAVRWQNGKVLGAFDSLVNPQRRIPNAATEVHGISYFEVVNAPLFCDHVAAELELMLRDAVIVAHNAEFDLRFLNAELLRAHRVQWSGVAVCTLTMARKLLTLRNYRLTDVADHLGVERMKDHRAGADVNTTLGVFQKMLERLQAKRSDKPLRLSDIRSALVVAPAVRLKVR